MEVLYTASAYEVYAVPAQGGAKRKICEKCGPTESLSSDGKQFLATQQGSPRAGINLVDVASGNTTLVLQHSQYRVSTPRFSPDGKWIAFRLIRGAGAIDILLAPFRGGVSVPEQDWITVTPAPANVHQAFWSPDGGLVYYVIGAGGSTSLMARRLDRNHHPVDPPFRVFEFPGRPTPASAVSDLLTAMPGRFIGAMTENSSNIWMTDLPK